MLKVVVSARIAAARNPTPSNTSAEQAMPLATSLKSFGSSSRASGVGKSALGSTTVNIATPAGCVDLSRWITGFKFRTAIALVWWRHMQTENVSPRADRVIQIGMSQLEGEHRAGGLAWWHAIFYGQS